MDEVITTLDGLTTGRFKVTTSHGTYHIVDLDESTVTRYGAPGREWGDKLLVVDPLVALPGNNPKVAAHYEPITADGKPFKYLILRNATVGEQMRFDNNDEWRITSAIASIEAIE